jgi:hypothetical protein
MLICITTQFGPSLLPRATLTTSRKKAQKPAKTVLWRSGRISPVDKTCEQITLVCMTLLQTRVEDEIARQFEKAARKRGETTYSFLQKIVLEAAEAPEPETWESHWQKSKALHLKPSLMTLAALREESGER